MFRNVLTFEIVFQLEWTPLHFASQNGDTATVEVLLDRGASVDAFDEVGHCTALFFSATMAVE